MTESDAGTGRVMPCGVPSGCPYLMESSTGLFILVVISATSYTLSA